MDHPVHSGCARVRTLIACIVATLALGVAACDVRGPGGNATRAGVQEQAEAQEHAPTPTNRVDIPPAVRQNLGITFVTVEARLVEQTLRVPGRFEYLPSARREYRTMLPGRVEILVDQYQHVGVGEPLYRIESPAWHEMQRAISDAEAGIERHRTRLASFGPLREAHRNHERMLERAIEIRRERVAQLEGVVGAGGGRVGDLIDARGAVATSEAELAEVMEKEAELEADEAESRAELGAVEARYALLLDTAASLMSLAVEDLVRPTDGLQGSRPRWRTMRAIEIRAEEDGVVELLGVTNGAWADEKSIVVSVVRPERLRFRAVALQSDLGRLRDGLAARIVAPSPTRLPGAIDLAESMAGVLKIGLGASADERTIDLIVQPQELATWARAGVSAQLEIVTDSSAAPMLAVPSAAVQRDGLVSVLFRRDPADPNKAIRIEADLGIGDGRWVVVNSGLRRGDEVVLDGSFQLMLATSTSGGQPKGGHFHADGTFHAEDH